MEECGVGRLKAIEFCVVALEILRALANKGYNNKSSDDGPACADKGGSLIVDGAISANYETRESYPANNQTVVVRAIYRFWIKVLSNNKQITARSKLVGFTLPGVHNTRCLFMIHRVGALGVFA